MRTPIIALKWIGSILIGLLMLIPVVIALRTGLYHSFVDDALSGWGMWGTFAIYFSTRPSRKEISATVFLALIMRLAYDLAIGEKGYPGFILIGMGAFLGLSSLGALLIRSVGAPSESRSMVRRSLVVIALFNYLGVFLSLYISIASVARPNKLDYFLYAFDGSLGFEPAFNLAKWIQTSESLLWFEAMVYNSFGFWFGLIYAMHLSVHGKFRLDFVELFIANALIGFSLYLVFPAMGPKYAFPSFPELPAAILPRAIAMRGLPNSMPSLHFGGALLIFWMARPWRWMRVLTGMLVVFTAIATLALGEHYLVDLVVAVPYALAILALSANVPGRSVSLISGTVMVLAWLAILRFEAMPQWSAWLSILVTITVSFLLERRLATNVWSSAPQLDVPIACTGTAPADFLISKSVP